MVKLTIFFRRETKDERREMAQIDGIEWQTGVPPLMALNGSAVYRLLNGKALKAATKKRKRLSFSDQRERLPFSER